MRIAQVAPVVERVPPRLYGGTERVVSYLTEELVRQGHEVTLFASGDSMTLGRLVPICEEALRLSPRALDPMPYNVLLIESVLQQADSFDIVHFHTDYMHFPTFRRHKVPSITTLHGRLDLPGLMPLYSEFSDMPLVSISNAQRLPIPWANWARTIYHGLPQNLLQPRDGRGNYLAFLGRICPEKRPDRAIRIARDTGMELKIAAKVDAVDKAYFEQVIRPMMADAPVEFVGEITESEKSDFLGKAYATVFPIDWPEPFGLTMIESMACGTPVIAYCAGSVPEIVNNGTTGFIVGNQRQAVEAVKRAGELDRRAIRREFETRFSVERMTADYLDLYAGLVERPKVSVDLVTSASALDRPRDGLGMASGEMSR